MYIIEPEELFYHATKGLEGDIVSINESATLRYDNLLNQLRNDNRLQEIEDETFACCIEYKEQIEDDYGFTMIEMGLDDWGD